MAPDLSVVVAVYNEHPDNLHRVCGKLAEIIAPCGVSWEVVFVNDGSKAETSQTLVQIARTTANVKLVELSRNFGQQAAISAGLNHASGSAIVNIDSDLQDPPELIPEMLRYWQMGYEVVYAQRSTRRDRFSKQFSAFIFYRVLRTLSSVDIPWDTGDFRLIDRKVLHALNQLPEKTRFLRGQIPWLGFRQVGLPIDRGAREIGESTYTLRKLLQLAADGLLAFSVAPLFAIPLIGSALLAVSLLGFIIAACTGQLSELSNGVMLGIMCASTGLQLLAVGTVAVYIAKILDEVRARPTYLVSRVLGNPLQEGEEKEKIPAAHSPKSYESV